MSFGGHRLSFLLGMYSLNRYLFWNFAAIPWSIIIGSITCVLKISRFNHVSHTEWKENNQIVQVVLPATSHLHMMSVPLIKVEEKEGPWLSDGSAWGVVSSPSAFPAHPQAISADFLLHSKGLCVGLCSFGTWFKRHLLRVAVPGLLPHPGTSCFIFIFSASYPPENSICIMCCLFPSTRMSPPWGWHSSVPCCIPRTSNSAWHTAGTQPVLAEWMNV